MSHHHRPAVACYQGRYHRTIGHHIASHGRLARKKFYLGTDQSKAQVAAALLEDLWGHVVKEYEAAEALARSPGGFVPGEANRVTGEWTPQQPRDFSQGPYWRPEALAIATAICRGDKELPIKQWPREGASTFYTRLSRLRETYPVIAFVPAHPHDPASARAELERDAQTYRDEAEGFTRRAEERAQLADLTGLPAARAAPTTPQVMLHDAIEAFAGGRKRDILLLRLLPAPAWAAGHSRRR